MFNFINKKSQDARINMCIKFLLWELEAATPLYRAKILAIGQILGLQLLNDETKLSGLVDRPLDFSRHDLMAYYEVLEATRNNSMRQESQLKKSLSKYGIEFSELENDHTKQCSRALEIWMATIGAGIVVKKLEDVRKIWELLSCSTPFLDQAIDEIKDAERYVIEMTGATSDDEGIFLTLDHEEWKTACHYIPAQFKQTTTLPDNRAIEAENITAEEAWRLALNTISKGNTEDGIKWTRIAAEQGEPNAQYSLALLCVSRDDAQAVAWCRKAAEQDLAEAQYNLGGMYLYGNGVPQDYAKAEVWWRKAAEQGLANAQYNLGIMYDEGNGVKQDYGQALTWYRKAAEQGLADAQYNLGCMYLYGNGVPQDYEQAEVWWRKAAEQGLANAQYNLGNMYQTGQSVAQDYGQAVSWWRKAAGKGHAVAQSNLGVMYGMGKCVPQDFVEAHFWFNLAATAGVEDALKNRDLIAKRMTTADIAKAQKRAREWFAAHPAQ